MISTTDRDENWALARSIQLTPSDTELPAGIRGFVIAEPHAAGWFISARYDPRLSEADVADFSEFVAVRTYLLLEQGARGRVWERREDGTWCAYCVDSDLRAPVPAGV